MIFDYSLFEHRDVKVKSPTLKSTPTHHLQNNRIEQTFIVFMSGRLEEDTEQLKHSNDFGGRLPIRLLDADIDLLVRHQMRIALLRLVDILKSHQNDLLWH